MKNNIVKRQNVSIKLNRSQWEKIGKKAGWIIFSDNDTKMMREGGLLETVKEFLSWPTNNIQQFVQGVKTKILDIAQQQSQEYQSQLALGIQDLYNRGELVTKQNTANSVASNNVVRLGQIALDPSPPSLPSPPSQEPDRNITIEELIKLNPSLKSA